MNRENSAVLLFHIFNLPAKAIIITPAKAMKAAYIYPDSAEPSSPLCPAQLLAADSPALRFQFLDMPLKLPLKNQRRFIVGWIELPFINGSLLWS